MAKVEAGNRRIDAVELIAVLDALNVDLVVFLTRLRRQLRKRKSPSNTSPPVDSNP
jgi:hypothetical protein